MRILKYRLIVIVILQLTFSLNVLAVEFYNINSLFGISYRVANSICKDDNGFIWASSKTGILRLADTDYRIYQLPYDKVGAIVVKLVYQDSKLIAYTNNGQIFLYNPVLDQFELLLDMGKTLHTGDFDFYSLLIDHDGVFWIAINSGLYKYQSGQLTLINEISTEKYSIAWLDEQHLIIAKSSGIFSFDIHSLESRVLFRNTSITPFLASSLFFDRVQQQLWIGTFSNGLFVYNFDSNNLSHILQSTFPKQPILAIEENSDSTLLIGIDGQGVWELNKLSRQVLNIYKEDADDPHSLRGNGVYDIYCDHGKRVWICTISGGVSFTEQASPLINQIAHNVNNANSLVNNDVNGIVEDHEGKIWFATNNGISCWDVASDKWKNLFFNKYEQAQVFLTLCEDNQGRIWAGSYSSGFYVLDGKTGKELAHYSRDNKELSSVSNFIMDIFKDSQGDLWIGGVNGKFVCYQSSEDKFKTYTEEPISSFAELSPNQILLGCSYGLKLLDKNTGVSTDFLSGYVAQDIVVIGDKVWVATSGEGLVEYDYKKGIINKYTTQAGLPSNFINSIIYVDDCLWVGTESGLCRFNPKDKTAFTFSSLYPLSGISYNKCALFRLKSGQLAWGTNNGAIFFAPQSIKEISSKGKIFLQDFTILGRSIRELPALSLDRPVDSLQSINLKYSQNTISLELISIGIQSGSRYSWKLEGFDNSWSAPSENRIITYTNIPSGKFELKIKLYDSSLSNIIADRTIAIKVIPPFWRRSWFWILIFIIVSCIIFLYLLYYINRIRQEHTEEKVRFFTNTAHDIRTSLTLIKAPIEELAREKKLSEKGQKYLDLAIVQVRQLSSVVSQLMDFQKVDIGKEHLLLTMTDIVKLVSTRYILLSSYAQNKNIELLFVSDCEGFMTAVDEVKMEKIIDNLITNAIKYSPNNSQIHITLHCEAKKWMLQVKDNGIGISKQAQRQLFKEFYRGDNAINSKVVGSGIGLLLVKSYVALHNGQISFSSQENVGSTFKIEIPFISIFTETESTNGLSDIALASSNDQNATLQEIPDNETIGFKEMKVLIVEDNDDLRDFMKSALDDEFDVITAVDGVEAWEVILKQIPDLVVSDIMMPNMDGFGLCKTMKSTFETSHIPIILLTALSEKTDQLHGLGLGADDYLVKPFDMSLLVGRIRSVIRNREAVREKTLKMNQEDPIDQIHPNNLNDQFVNKMMEVAHANISNSEFNKDEFASAMNVSSSLLYKKIKSITDQSPTDFIKTIRLNHAVELLQLRKYTVTEVSELCGFASVAYFSTVFRKRFGKSPSEFLE